MIVEPGFTRHPKFVQLKNGLRTLSESVAAAEVLLQLWEHCQLNQKGEFWEGVDFGYVEAVCGWNGTPGALFALLERLRWVHSEPNGVRIHEWNENNISLISAWLNGNKGGRPRKRNRPDNQSVNRPDNRPDNQSANRTGTDRVTDRGRDQRDLIEGKREGGNARAPEGAVADFPEAVVPGLEEVLVFCRKTKGMPEEILEETGRKFWEHYQTEAYPPWTDAGQKRFQWEGKLKKWARGDREKTASGRGAGTKNGAEKTREQLEAELAACTDGARRRELRTELDRVGVGQ